MQIESTNRPAALTDVYLACVSRDDVPRILRYFELNRDLIALAHAFGLTMWEVHTWAFRPEIQMCLKVPPQPTRPEPVQPKPACDDKPASPSPRMPNHECRMPRLSPQLPRPSNPNRPLKNLRRLQNRPPLCNLKLNRNHINPNLTAPPAIRHCHHQVM